MFTKLILITLLGAAGAAPPSWVDTDWTLTAPLPLYSENVTDFPHFGAAAYLTTANLNAIFVPGVEPAELYMAWNGPDPSTPGLTYTFQKLDFASCTYPADAINGLQLQTTASPNYFYGVGQPRRVWLGINLKQSLIEQSDVWDATTSTANGFGRLFVCIRASVKLGAIEISHLKTKIQFSIHTTEGFTLDTQSLQCWTDQTNVQGSVETKYLDKPYLCDSRLQVITHPPNFPGYLPGQSFCFCLRAQLAASNEVFVADVLNTTATSMYMTFGANFQSGPTSPYFYKTCDYNLKVCRVCVLLTQQLWPPNPCMPGCSTMACNATVCLQGGINVTGYVNIGFGSTAHPPRMLGGRQLATNGSPPPKGSGFVISGNLAPNTQGPDKKLVRKCITSVATACFGNCSNKCIRNATKSCEKSPFLNKATAETAASITGAKKMCKKM
jgi:hypothetical protein